MHRFFDAANAITLLGLTAAVLGGACSMRGRLAWAAALLVVSGLCDLFDGFVARKLTRTDVDKLVERRIACPGTEPSSQKHRRSQTRRRQSEPRTPGARGLTKESIR